MWLLQHNSLRASGTLHFATSTCKSAQRKRRTMLKNYIMRSYNAFSNLQLQSGKAGELQDH